ncbi:hypothetical protein [Streptomyces sp. CoH17]|uniref:hypothetical protein n=1 Tax=Streptomyces sp. CoH17 TaxID=2992806 RepID=UPI00226F3FB0|nr:hypothetical protein [Streptomyces sp. CoH17]
MYHGVILLSNTGLFVLNDGFKTEAEALEDAKKNLNEGDEGVLGAIHVTMENADFAKDAYSSEF